MNYAELAFFYKSAFLNDDAVIKKYACSNLDIEQSVEGKTVALVGNARSLSERTYGDEIDSHDIVIRINRAPMVSSLTHGCKTTWLALATSMSKENYHELHSNKLIWMSHKRKRIRSWMVGESFYLCPMNIYNYTKSLTGSQPSTGFMIFYWLCRTSFRSLDLYGFDFFKSLSLSGSRTAHQVPHDFKAEEKWFEQIMSMDSSIRIHH